MLSLQNENVRFEQGEMFGQRGVSLRVGMEATGFHAGSSGYWQS
jgi:hypothetical protein